MDWPSAAGGSRLCGDNGVADGHDALRRGTLHPDSTARGGGRLEAGQWGEGMVDWVGVVVDARSSGSDLHPREEEERRVDENKPQRTRTAAA